MAGCDEVGYIIPTKVAFAKKRLLYRRTTTRNALSGGAIGTSTVTATGGGGGGTSVIAFAALARIINFGTIWTTGCRKLSIRCTDQR